MVYINRLWLRKIEVKNDGEGDVMLKNIAWQMFAKTGNIEYFMQYKDLRDRRVDFMTEAGAETALDGENGLHQDQRDGCPGSGSR